MTNWKWHLKCLLKGLGIYAILGVGGYLFFKHLSFKAQFYTLFTPLVLLGAYAWGRGMEAGKKY